MSEAVESGQPEISPEAKSESKPESKSEAKPQSLPAFPGPIVVRARLSRVAFLAIAMALAAAAGSTVGAMAASMFVKPQPAFDDARSIEVNNLRGVITQLSAEIASLKTAVDSNAKASNAQIAGIAARVDRAQAEPVLRVQKLSELVEKLERRAGGAPEITGSIAQKQQDRPPVVSGWVVREVFDGRAMVENDRMGFFEAVPGARLPGIGRVETIRRQDGRWVVVTPKGLIVSQR